MLLRDLSPTGNFVQFPDFFIDHVMSVVTPAEWKIITYMVRRTYGFRQRTATITTRDFMDGKAGKNESGTGLTRTTVRKSIERLVESGLVSKKKRGNSHAFEFNLDCNMGDFLEFFGKVMDLKDEKPTETTLSTSQGEDSVDEGGQKMAPSDVVYQNDTECTENDPLPDQKKTPTCVKNDPPIRHTERQTETNRIAGTGPADQPAVAPSTTKRDGSLKDPKVLCREWFEWMHQKTYDKPYLENPRKDMSLLKNKFQHQLDKGAITPEEVFEEFKAKAVSLMNGSVERFEGEVTVAAVLGWWSQIEAEKKPSWNGQQRRLPKIRRRRALPKAQ